MTKWLLSVLVLLAILTPFVLADTLKLNDGTKIDGHVIPQGDKYWVKLADGTSKTIR